MLSWSKRVGPAATLIAVATLLGGCVTGTEVSYSEYQYDRYGGTERTYERNLYADPSRGIESERCRTVVRRRINSFGEEVVMRERVCGQLCWSRGRESFNDSTTRLRSKGFSAALRWHQRKVGPRMGELGPSPLACRPHPR